MGLASVPAHFQAALERFGDRTLLEDHAGTMGLAAMLSTAARVAHALRARHGLRPGDRVGLWADNSRRWILADLAIQVAGGVNCPRGTDTPDDEVLEIFGHAEVALVFVHDAKAHARLAPLRASLPSVREVVVLDPADVPAGTPTFDDLVREGEGGPSFGTMAAALRPDDVATIIYTSGTTGRPKGVVLTQSNFLHQVETIPDVLGIGPDDVFLSILPPWHIFERIVEYVGLTQGARLVYTDLRRFRHDLAAKSPTFVASVPRLWEAVYDAVRKALAEGGRLRRAAFAVAYAAADLRARAWDRARGHVFEERGGHAGGTRPGRLLAGLEAALLWPADRLLRTVVFRRLRAMTGGRLRGAVVGGGLMPPHVDRFFRAVGVGVLVGYGLTETSPVLTVRRERRNVLGTIGTAIPRVQIEIRDPQTGKALPPGEVGAVWTRGPQVMRGYHRDEGLTRQVLSPDGWFDTGDLGMTTDAGDLCFRGRQKETIVLSGGENVEPSRVETAILRSRLVAQAVVVGQDRKALAALVVPRPEDVARRLRRPADGPLADLAASPEVSALLRADVVERTGPGSGLRPFEVVSRVHVLPEPLSPENGLLTATLKPKRHVIAARFAAEIDRLYAG